MSQQDHVSVGEILNQIKTLEPNSARLFYERLAVMIQLTEIRAIEKGFQLCVQTQRIGGESLTVEDFGYQNTRLIWIDAKDSDGNQSFVLSHPSSVHIVSKWIDAKSENAPRRPIGFLGNIEELLDKS